MSLKKKVIHYYFSHYLLFIIIFSTICCGYFFVIEKVQKCESFDQILLLSYKLTQHFKINLTAVFNNSIKDIPANEFEDMATFPPYRQHKPPIVNWHLMDLLLYYHGCRCTRPSKQNITHKHETKYHA